MRSYGTDGWFRAVQSIVEERIRKAQEEGLFDNLPGKGKPLRLDDDSRIAPHLRASYRILKNAGILPPEMQLRKINEKILASNIMGRFSVSSEMDQIYSERIVERLRTRKARHNLENFKRS
jgi:hypothetical protein